MSDSKIVMRLKGFDSFSLKAVQNTMSIDQPLFFIEFDAFFMGMGVFIKKPTRKNPDRLNNDESKSIF